MPKPPTVTRRDLLKTSARAAACVALAPWLRQVALAADPPAAPRKKILFFTKSSGFQHFMIERPKDSPQTLSRAEKILTGLGAANGFDITCSKDGSLFSDPAINDFDAFIFYTTGDLTEAGADKTPPMTKAAKAQFLQSIKDGKGFIGLHSATDTFHSKPASPPSKELIRDQNETGADDFDPYIQMLGGEFIRHGAQQPSILRCADPKFPGASGFDGAKFVEEWYSLKNFAPDLHVILIQDPTGMKGPMYSRQPFPETWARGEGKGPVFYTSMGHREDVWRKAEFTSLLVGAMNWASGRVEVDVTPNIKDVTPQADPKPFPA
ncbi:MAG: ThuA domain-containing protein [Planctomycetota bacterium]|nr:ThuA domain-containing protein [Planctomycetota bacterium]